MTEGLDGRMRRGEWKSVYVIEQRIRCILSWIPQVHAMRCIAPFSAFPLDGNGCAFAGRRDLDDRGNQDRWIR
jgi:hypothetical protein